MPKVCPKCDVPVATDEVFCGRCGAAAAEVVESPEAVAEYEEILGEFAADGVLDAAELAELADLRLELGVSQATHDAIVARDPRLAQGLRVAIEVDEATLVGFVAGTHGFIRLRLRNLGSKTMRSATVRHAVSGEDALREEPIRMLKPGDPVELGALVLLPRHGHFMLEAVVRVEDLRGTVQQYFRADPIGFRVGRESAAGPQSVSVHLDASAMRVAGDPLVNVGGVRDGDRGGALSERQWGAVGLRSMSAEEWGQWAVRRDAGARQAAHAKAEAEAHARQAAHAKAEAEAHARAEAEAKVREAASFAARLAAVAPRAALVRVPAGTFEMGEESSDEDDERPVHTVTITRAFELWSTPVTQAQWRALMGNDPSGFSGDARPVEQVSWFDAVAYCNALSRAVGLEEAYVLTDEEGEPGEEGFAATVTWKGLACPGFRLPTEAEWEYACRAGTTGELYGELDAIAWHEGNSGSETHPVAKKQPNAWGLYDTIGNVWEWVWDWKGDYFAGDQRDPTGAASGAGRVNRGGSWDFVAVFARAACRNDGGPGGRYDYLGFRPSRSLP